MMVKDPYIFNVIIRLLADKKFKSMTVEKIEEDGCLE